MEPNLFHRITFCLLRPENPGNVGSAARAMKNMGFSRLSLVASADPRQNEAVRMAHRSGEVLENARLFPDLRAALADARWIVGLTGRSRNDRNATRSIEALAAEIWAYSKEGEVLLLFGPEGTGLSNDELACCHRTASIPTGGAFTSLNLAQAVLVVAYVLLQTREDSPPAVPERTPVPAGEMEPLFGEMESTLERIGFLKPPAKKETVRKLKALFTRAGLDDREVRLLRAIFRQVRWAAEKKD